MPSFYLHPATPEMKELGATLIQIPTGEGTLYGEAMTPKRRAGAPAVWFLTVGTNQAVVWTKPEDVEIDAESPYATFFPRAGNLTTYVRTDSSLNEINAYSGSPDEEAFLKELFPNK